MKENNLSNRLKAILQMVDVGAIAADIGADHGLLAAALVTQGHVTKMYASENKKGPFAILKKNIFQLKLADKITLQLADGIIALPSDVDTVIIAGMGGELIAQILKRGQERLKNVTNLILAPNTAVPSLRRTLLEIGYTIYKEEIVFENHYYEIIKAKPGKTFYSETQLFFGPCLLENKSANFLKKYHNRCELLRCLLKENITEERRQTITEELERIESIW